MVSHCTKQISVLCIIPTVPSTEYGNCSHGDVRLVNYTDNEDTRTREGRIEICINNAWGTVCDNLFDSVDAEVFCHQLEGFKREGLL